ncbi:hypothetical protein YPPY10_2292, partial [Yersinia pestis PY-10]
MLKACQ